ncbi:hypothetical protein K0U27_03590 [archaeon]|nr:hypothetical protein [archaeon]
MKNAYKVLIVIGVVVVSLLASDQYYLSFQNQELKKSDWVQNCIPAEGYQAVPSIGLYNHTHSFDLRTCSWNPTEHGTPGFLESLYISFMEPIFLDAADILEIPHAYALGRGPLERLPLDGVTILGMNDSMTVKANELSIIKVDYHTNYPNTKYVILIQIMNEKRETVLLNWIEGLQIDLHDRPGSYVCGDKICYDQWITDNPNICGDKICPNKYSSSKSLESSWVPAEPGTYEIVAFAWESVDNPSALSPPFDINVVVIDNDEMKSSGNSK